MSNSFMIMAGEENSFIDCSEPCIRCGALAHSLNGTFSHLNGQITSVKNMRSEDRNLLSMLLDAIKSSSTTPANSAELKSILHKAESGMIDETETEAAFSAINPDLAEFYSRAREHSWSIQIILTLIGLAMAAYGIYDSNKISSQVHTDAEKVHELLTEQTALDRDQNLILQKLHEALLDKQMRDGQKAKPERSKSKSKSTHPQQNRHARRKAAASAKRRYLP